MNSKILKYQEVDIELKKLENKLHKDDSLKKMNSSKEVAKSSQELMIKLNEEALNLKLELEKLIQVKDKGISVVDKYVNNNSEENLLELMNRLNQTSKQLEELSIRISNNEIKMRKVLKEFENAKKQIILSKKEFDENKYIYEALKKNLSPEVERIRKNLLSMEKEIEPEILNKYKSLRKDGIMPVFVKLVNRSCGYCRVELPNSTIDKLKLNGQTECEHCRRIIYDK